MHIIPVRVSNVSEMFPVLNVPPEELVVRNFFTDCWKVCILTGKLPQSVVPVVLIVLHMGVGNIFFRGSNCGFFQG